MFRDMTVEENLAVGAYLARDPDVAARRRRDILPCSLVWQNVGRSVQGACRGVSSKWWRSDGRLCWVRGS